jgi:hypothetical protein
MLRTAPRTVPSVVPNAALSRGAAIAVVTMLVCGAPSTAQEHGAAPAAHAGTGKDAHAAKEVPATQPRKAAVHGAPGAKPAAVPIKEPRPNVQLDAASTADAEVIRGHVDGSIVRPAKPQVATSAPPRRADHAHGERPNGAHTAAAAAKKASAGGAATVQEVSAKASAAEAAEKVVAALRAAAARPRATAHQTAPRAAAAPRTAPSPRQPSYAVTWPSRPVSVRWPEAPERIEVAWPDERPPDVRLRWESAVPNPPGQ